MAKINDEQFLDSFEPTLWTKLSETEELSGTKMEKFSNHNALSFPEPLPAKTKNQYQERYLQLRFLNLV